MPLTQTDLIAEAAKLGVHLEPRTLTSWRAKGLLPQLTERGSGRGRGKSYSWSDPEILNQVMAIRALFAQRTKTEYVHLALWHCGYDVDPPSARDLWLKRLRRIQIKIDNNTNKIGGRAAYLSDLVSKLEEKIYTHPDFSTQNRLGLIEAICNSIYDLGEDFEIEADYGWMAEYLSMILGGVENPLAANLAISKNILSEKRAVYLAEAFTNSLSLPMRIERIANASDEDLNATSAFLRKLRILFGRFAPPGADVCPLPAFGEAVAILYLCFRMAGFSSQLEKTAMLADDVFQMTGPNNLIGRDLVQIWEGITLDQILGRLASV